MYAQQAMTQRAAVPRDEYVLYRSRPAAPTNVQAQKGSLEATIFWNRPANLEGVDGWRVFLDNEANLVWWTSDPNARQATIKLPGDASRMAFVCAVSKLGREGPKVAVKVQSNTDKLVVTGTGGATGGSAAPTPPQWPSEPGGGSYEDDDGYYY